MFVRMASRTVSVATAVVLLLSGAVRGQEAERLRAFYFGNSLTGCSDPGWHGELGASAGKDWVAEVSAGAGWQLWQHRHELRGSGVPLDRGSNGDLTIDPREVKNAKGRLRRFFNETWDAVVLQPFSMGLTWTCTEMWGVTFEKETDVGDIASAADIIGVYLALNPKGRVFIYQNWPAMEAGKVPPDDQLPLWAVEMKKRAEKAGKSLRAAEFPDRAAFDYEQAWAKATYAPSDDPKRFWMQKNPRSKDYHDQLFAALKKRFPQLWQSGRLRVIPVGDIFLALHRKMKAGEFPGCTDIGDFYTDVQHIRGGLPRYTVAAAFYASLFGEHPGRLGWKLYNSEARYAAVRFFGNDPHHDRGELLEITPERARIVNDTVWEVITRHPDAKGPE